LEVADVVLTSIRARDNVILGHQDLMPVLIQSVQVQVRRHVIAVSDLLDGKELAFDTTHDAGGPLIFEAQQPGVVQADHVATDIPLTRIRPDHSQNVGDEGSPKAVVLLALLLVTSRHGHVPLWPEFL
jgi:hypothetical protein